MTPHDDDEMQRQLDREAELLEELDREERLRDAMRTRKRGEVEDEGDRRRSRKPRRVGDFVRHPDTGRIYFRRF